MKKWFVILAVALVAYVLWRKFGSGVKSAISAVTK
jgi:hypothetical protein